jgi:hypothetical protein
VYRVMSCCFEFESVVSLDLVLSYCNKECLSMCTLSGFVCHSVMEVSLCMITKFLNKLLQVTTLVNLTFPPKSVGKPSISRGITRYQRLSARSYTTFVGTRSDSNCLRVNAGPCIRVIAFLTVLRKRFHESWWLWNIVRLLLSSSFKC